MTTFVNDEIEQLKNAKMDRMIKDAKKHKTGTQQKQQVEPQQTRPLPPILLINAIITQATTLSFPTPMKGISLAAESFRSTDLLDKSLKLIQQVHPNLTEEQTKQASTNLIHIFREVCHFGYIEKNTEDDNLLATKKALIYSNTISFLPVNDPYSQYAHYLDLARN